jgi:hypothetical protein
MSRANRLDLAVEGISHSPFTVKSDFSHDSYVRLSKDCGIYQALIELQTKEAITISKGAPNGLRYLLWVSLHKVRKWNSTEA